MRKLTIYTLVAALTAVAPGAAFGDSWISGSGGISTTATSGHKAALMGLCSEYDGKLEWAIVYGDVYVGASEEPAEMKYRVDDGEVIDNQSAQEAGRPQWVKLARALKMNDHDGVFANLLLGADRFLLSVVAHDGETVSSAFDVSGFASVMTKLKCLDAAWAVGDDADASSSEDRPSSRSFTGSGPQDTDDFYIGSSKWQACFTMTSVERLSDGTPIGVIYVDVMSEDTGEQVAELAGNAESGDTHGCTTVRSGPGEFYFHVNAGAGQDWRVEARP